MSVKRIRFLYRNAPSYDYVVKFDGRRHHRIYDRHYGTFANRDELLGEAPSLDDAIFFLKATAKSGYLSIQIDDI
ncbi:MAG: hypothetical protein RL186_1558 [Pseudomonadota bacterium]|jgi:hypothetical protein